MKKAYQRFLCLRFWLQYFTDVLTTEIHPRMTIQ